MDELSLCLECCAVGKLQPCIFPALFTITATKAALQFHIPHRPFLVGENEIQRIASPGRFLHPLEKEILTSGFAALLWGTPPAHEDLGKEMCQGCSAL